MPAVVDRSKRLHLAHEQEGRAEDPRLLVRALCELGARDPAREAEVVPDARARACLASDRLALHDEGAKPLRRRVDGRREPGRPGADDRDLEGLRRGFELGGNPVPAGKLRVRRIDEHVSAGQEHDRALRRVQPCLVERVAPLRRVARMEGVRNAVAGEQVAELVAALRPGIGDERDLPAVRRQVRAGPLVQELTDDAMEELVGWPRRTEDVVVDVPEGHREPDRLRGLFVAPAAPGDEESPLRMRVNRVNAGEELRPGELRKVLRRQDERDGRTFFAQGLERRESVARRGAADDRVVAGVPLQLARDPRARVCVRIDGEDERLPLAGAHDNGLLERSGRRRVASGRRPCRRRPRSPEAPARARSAASRGRS